MSNYENIDNLNREVEEGVQNALNEFDKNNPFLYPESHDDHQLIKKMYQKNEEIRRRREKIPEETRKWIINLQIMEGRRPPYY